MTSLGAFALLLLAQAPASAPYRVGAGDVLEITVDGRADLSRLPTVQPTGTVWLPRAGEVEVRGLTTDEIAARVAPLLAGPDLPSPRVKVKVQEYQSQFVWVRGAVNRPGRKPLRAGSRLVDALLDAGGFRQNASGDVTVERASGSFPDGSRQARFHFGGGSPTPDELAQLGLALQPGDAITVGLQTWVTVSGAVKKPGRYPFEDALTVTRLVGTAGGALRSASDRVVVRRAGGQVEADLEAIRDGKAEDVVLAPGDEVVVKARGL
jgi:polysaccharide export outer membrane protein